MSDIASPSPPTTWKTRVFDAVEDVGYRFEKVGDRLNSWAASNKVGRWFRFKDRQSSLTVELRAGFITFLMVSYVLAVQPNILSATGGPCNPEEVCDPDLYKEMGRACLGNPYDSGALKCLEELKTNLITATAASSLISTFLIGVLGNLPLALAPGIGITAYVAYDVVGPYGTGDLTYSQAMTAIFIEGWIFIILSVTGVRGGLVKYMPKNVAMATSVGIGLLLAFTGLGNLGVIAFDPNTLVGIGGCDARDRSFIYTFPAPINASQLAEGNLSSITQGGLLPIPAAVYGCNGKLMRSATMWLGISGGVLMSLLLFAGVKGAMVIGIVFVTVISWIPDHAASYLGASSAVAGGATRLELFKQVVAAPSLSLTGLSWDWSAFTKSHLWIALFTFLYIDLLDCTGTLLSMARLLDQFMPGFMSESYEFPGQMWAFLSDGIGILVGSMMGSTPLTVYIESAAGIEDGGRTGLTAVVVAFFFFVSLFFSPILASIPPFATGPALVLVGTILLGHIAHIEWDDIGQAIPAFLTIILMPFTYSVAYGVIAGLASYIIIHFPFWLWDTIMTKWNRGGGPYPRWTQKSRRLRNGMHHRRVYLSDGGGSRASFASLDPERSYHGGGGGLAMGVLPGSGLSLHPQNELTHPRHGGGEGGVGGYPGGLPPFPRPSPLFPAPGPRSPPGGGGGRLSRPGSKLSDLSDVDWDGGRPANRMLRRSITMDGGGNTPGGSVHGRPPLPGSFPGVGGGGRGEGLPLWERGEDDTFRRSFTYSGAGGLAGLAALFREGGAAVGDPRESSSYHGGDLYTNSSSRRESHGESLMSLRSRPRGAGLPQAMLPPCWPSSPSLPDARNTHKHTYKRLRT